VTHSPQQSTRATLRNGSVLAEYRTFLARAVGNPGRVGAVAPSSAGLAREMTKIVPTWGSPTVVELGPGTGALSGAVAQRLPPGSRHVAVELDDGMVKHLRSTLPGLEVVQGDAADLRMLLRQAGIQSVDAVISGLPWSLFTTDAQRAILGEVGRVLTPGGAFTTIAYVQALGMPKARRFRALLDETFDEVVLSRTVWRNVPPSRVYLCRRPRS
jgi:phosphatidylethanolamine/phosphatidyl-N-methylethanolamine N-methyltransferase